MNSSELLAGVRRLNSQLDETKPAWNSFFQVAINSWRSRNRQNVSQSVDALRQSLRKIQLSSYPVSQQRALETIQASAFVGEPMVQQLDAILRSEGFDPEGSAQRLEQLNGRVTRFFGLLDQISNLLDEAKVAPASETEVASLQVVFAHETEVRSVADLSECVRAWDQILRGFAMLKGIRTEDLKVVSIHKASPLILEISAPLGYLAAFGVACNLVLNGVERYLRLKRAMLEIRSVELNNKKLENDLEASSEKMKEALAADAADKLVSQHGDPKADGEIKNCIRISIEKLYVFVERGGDISARMPTKQETLSDKDMAAVKAVSESFAQIRLIREGIDARLLSDGGQGGEKK
jgi:hypothetical protein